MFFALTWGLASVLLALWSLTCWGLHAVTLWAITSAATITNEAAAVDTSLIPAWLQIWMPLEILEMFQALLASFGPMVQALLTTVPALGGIVTVLAWVVWGFGALAIVALAVGAKMLIALAKGQRLHKRSTAA